MDERKGHRNLNSIEFISGDKEVKCALKSRAYTAFLGIYSVLRLQWEAATSHFSDILGNAGTSGIIPQFIGQDSFNTNSSVTWLIPSVCQHKREAE